MIFPDMAADGMPGATVSFLFPPGGLLEPQDADPRPFPCFMCGGVMTWVRLQVQEELFVSRTRWCSCCEVLELRHTERYYPRAVTVRGQSWLDVAETWVPYLDHSAASYPSPA